MLCCRRGLPPLAVPDSLGNLDLKICSTPAFVAWMTACLAAPLLAQQPDVDARWIDWGEAITFRAAGNAAGYTLDVEDCPEPDAQCIILTSNGPIAFLTYSLDATALRGRRVRFSASMLVDFPGISRAQLFMRVDRPAGVGFHEYTPTSKDEPRDWTARELIGTIDDDAKQISIGLRFNGRGIVHLANPKLEKAGE